MGYFLVLWGSLPAHWWCRSRGLVLLCELVQSGGGEVVSLGSARSKSKDPWPSNLMGCFLCGTKCAIVGEPLAMETSLVGLLWNDENKSLLENHLFSSYPVLRFHTVVCTIRFLAEMLCDFVGHPIHQKTIYSFNYTVWRLFCISSCCFFISNLSPVLLTDVLKFVVHVFSC